jgi:hypothetical protein
VEKLLADNEETKAYREVHFTVVDFTHALYQQIQMQNLSKFLEKKFPPRLRRSGSRSSSLQSRSQRDCRTAQRASHTTAAHTGGESADGKGPGGKTSKGTTGYYKGGCI